MFDKFRVRVHSVPIEVDGETIYLFLRELPFEVIARNYESDDRADVMLKLIVASLCDENGKPVFANEEEGLREIALWRFDVMNKIAAKIIEINKLEPDPLNGTNRD